MTTVWQPSLLDGSAAEERAGFRLERFEVYNWGTFHGCVWHVDVRGENTLVTGDIGSGKSTLVDGLTTLLVPPQKLAYNKAAGADARERNARSYVLGYHRTERSDPGLAARPVPLRDERSYSVLLARFVHEALGQYVTLAQVFWMRDPGGPPSRLYVVAEGALSIAADLSGFGDEIGPLKKRLKAMGAEVFESFPPYGNAFRRLFGIETEAALHLFHQTVSMKSVGNLTDFVREHMLEAFPVEGRIQSLLRHFDDLSRAHEAVLKAKSQIEQLTPLVDDCAKHEALSEEIAGLRACRTALAPFFAAKKTALLEERCEQLDRERERLAARAEALDEEARAQDRTRDELKAAIAKNGGDRLEQLKVQLEERVAERDRRQRRAERYDERCEAVGLPHVTDADAFLANRAAIDTGREEAEEERADAQNLLTEASADLRALKQQHEDLGDELASLRQRRSNLPARLLALRSRLCEGTGLAEDELPFAGELLQVRDDERGWEGAIERLLGGFGRSLLVPDEHYASVARWVDATHLAQRLVYFRVRERKQAEPPQVGPTSVVRKLEVRPDAALCSWLEGELARRFDFSCCEAMDDFRRAPKALTRAGQVKGAGERHDKDDRQRIDDRASYVLGWSNEAKIEALAREQAALEERLRRAATHVGDLQARQQRAQQRLEGLAELAFFETFRDLDWRPLVLELQRLEEERVALEAASDVLRQLEARLKALEEARASTRLLLEKARSGAAVAESKKKVALEQLQQCALVLDEADEELRAATFPSLDDMRQEALGDKALTVESCEAREKELRSWLQDRVDAADKREKTLRDRVLKAMHEYRTRWSADVQEVDAALEAAAEYRAMLEALQADDLPRFEARFKELLNENTIREVAGFQSQLSRERQLILERIELINGSLKEIDYNPGRYIALEGQPTQDPEVRELQGDLRACTEGALTGSEDDAYSEAKFLQVKRIIERFRGREGLTEADRRWTQKVTDVRRWFTFSASERWREDDSEHEHYTDSGGKSGGQKEKLAYTVLAASLAYQFGLARPEARARSFRFVMIDEAFGRGSDESARFGLELFERLGLQLLIVTPLQKIRVIEPYVAFVGFVHNEGGSSSKVRNLSIEEYRAELEARSA